MSFLNNAVVAITRGTYDDRQIISVVPGIEGLFQSTRGGNQYREATITTYFVWPPEQKDQVLAALTSRQEDEVHGSTYKQALETIQHGKEFPAHVVGLVGIALSLRWQDTILAFDGSERQ